MKRLPPTEAGTAPASSAIIPPDVGRPRMPFVFRAAAEARRRPAGGRAVRFPP